jgi:DNA-binding beta-propeller fold protein YncE
MALKETGGTLEKMDIIETGAEPYGVIASPDGGSIYAAVSMENEVIEINTDTHEITATWSVPNEPRWLAIHPKGDTLFVAVARGDLMYRIDLADTTQVHELPLPESMPDELLMDLFGLTKEEAEQEFGSEDSAAVIDIMGFGIPTTARATGDITVSPDGRALFIPMLFVDNISPFPKALNMDEFHEEEEFGEPDFFNETSGYAQSNRLMPGIGEIPLLEDEEGNILEGDGPTRFYRQDEVLNGGNEDHDGGLNTITAGLEMMKETSVESSEFEAPRVLTSFPTSVLVSSNCDYLTATMEGQNVVTVIRRADICRSSGDPSDRCGGFMPVQENQQVAQVHTPPTSVLESLAGPGGQVFIGQDLYIHSLLDRNLSQANLMPIKDNLTREKQCPQNNWNQEEPYQAVAVDPFRDNSFPMCSYERFASQNHVKLTQFTLPPEVEEGRKLFLSARDGRMSTGGSSISCSTCHPGGRTDGLTWQFEDHPRQTPTLAGLISETTPVSWFDDVPTVADEVILTSQGRMGGDGLSDQEAANVAAFIDWVRPVDNSRSDVLSLEAELGQALFEDETVGCSKCHGGPQLTDNTIHQVNGVPVRTPKLRGIGATAPFLHDGSAPTLRDVVEISNSINMGNLKWLTDEDLDHLVAYLKAL